MPFLAIRLKSLSVMIRLWDPVKWDEPSRHHINATSVAGPRSNWVLGKNWRRDGISYAFLRSLPSPRRKQSSAAQPCFHKHVDHGLAIAAAGKGCRLSRPLKKPDAALLFVIIASVKIPPLVPLCLILPLLLPRPPPAPKATMWFTAKCHTRFSRCRKRPSSIHTLAPHTPSPFQKKESEKCSHLNVNELLLSTDQVITARPASFRRPPSLSLTRYRRGASYLGDRSTRLAKQFRHLLLPPSPSLFEIVLRHSLRLFISASLPFFLPSLASGRYTYGSFLRRKTNFNKP